MGNMMTLQWVQGRAWKASARGHEIVVDSPTEGGGTNLGMKPGELLVAAVGTCMSIDLSYYAERHPGLDLSQVVIELTWEDAPEPPSRIGVIRGTVSLPPGLSGAERAALSRVLSSCKIRRTLKQGAEVDIQVSFGE